MMYEELVKQCRDCLDSLCGECKYEHLQDAGNFVPCMNALLGEAADAIEQLSNAGSAYGRGWTLGYDAGREESKPRWIPVTEKLPEPEWYLVRCNEMLKHVHRIAYYYNSAWYENCNDITKFVTHWVPFPEPPKEEHDGV